MDSHELKGMLWGLLGVVCFGLTLPVTRLIVPYLDPVFIGLGRAVVAAIGAALLLLLTRQPWPNRTQLYQLLVVVLGVIVGFPVLSAIAMQTVPASHGGVVLGVLPLLTAVAAVFICHDRPSIGFWLTCAVGSGLVVSYSLMQSTEGLVGIDWRGDLALLAATLCAAVGYAMSGQLARQIGGWQVICWALVLALPLIAWPTWSHIPKDIESMPANAWLGFVYLALVSQWLGFFFWNHGLALGGVARVSQTQLAQPFITLLASVWLLGEIIEAQTLVFALLVVAIVAIGKKMPVTRGSGSEGVKGSIKES